MPSSSIQWFDYGTGTANTVTPTAADTLPSTFIDGAGKIELSSTTPTGFSAASPTITWWDALWKKRLCASVAAGVANRVVDVPFDSTSNGGWKTVGIVNTGYTDVRPVVWDGAANTAASFWLATPFDTKYGHAYVQVASTASVTVCLYLNNAAATTSTSTPLLGQNWTGTRQLVGVGLTTAGLPASFLVSNPTASTILVNRAATGTTGQVTLAPGTSATFTNVTNGQIWTDGAVNTRYARTLTGGTEAIPTFFGAAKYFVHSTAANGLGCVGPLAITGPFSYRTLATTGALSNFSSATLACQFGFVTTTGYDFELPALTGLRVINATADNLMSWTAMPAVTEPIYGDEINGGLIRVVADDPGAISVDSSNVASTVGTLTTNTSTTFDPAGDNAIRLSAASVPVSAYELKTTATASATTMMPMYALAAQYSLPDLTTTGTLRIVCVNPTDVVTVAGVSYTCSSTTGTVGLIVVPGIIAAGAMVKSTTGSALFVHYRSTGRNEWNTITTPRFNFGEVKAAALFSPAVEALAVFATDGTWTATRTISPAPVTWGLFGESTTIPSGTTVLWTIACQKVVTDPLTFASIVAGSAVPHACDGSGILTVKAALHATIAGTTPIVASAMQTINLSLAPAGSALSPSALLGSVGRHWLYRLHASGANATAGSSVRSVSNYAGAAWTASLMDGFMVESVQVPTVGSPPTPNINVTSIVVDVATVSAGPQQLRWSRTSTTNPLISRLVNLS